MALSAALEVPLLLIRPLKLNLFLLNVAIYLFVQYEYSNMYVYILDQGVVFRSRGSSVGQP